MRGVPWLLLASGMCVWSALLSCREPGMFWGCAAAAWGVVAGMSLADTIRDIRREE